MLERETMGIIQNKTIRAFSPKEVEFLVQNTMRTQGPQTGRKLRVRCDRPERRRAEPVGAVLDGFQRVRGIGHDYWSGVRTC